MKLYGYTLDFQLQGKKAKSSRFTCKYFRTFNASTGRSYMSSAFLIKLGIVYYRAATLLRRWSIIDFFLKKKTFSLFIPFTAVGIWYIFQKISVVSFFYSKFAGTFSKAIMVLISITLTTQQIASKTYFLEVPRRVEHLQQNTFVKLRFSDSDSEQVK